MITDSLYDTAFCTFQLMERVNTAQSSGRHAGHKPRYSRSSCSVSVNPTNMLTWVYYKISLTNLISTRLCFGLLLDAYSSLISHMLKIRFDDA